jgi:rhodanese-related sulfurtransferase
MNRLLALLVAGLLCAGNALAYDQGLAQGYAKLFAPAAGKAAPKALHMMKTEDFLAAVKAGEEMLILDVRTPAEVALIQFGLPNTLAIPLNELFQPENLDRLPAEGKVLVVCKGGHRAMAAATGLRHIGFEQVYVLKLGIADLAKKVNPKTAH